MTYRSLEDADSAMRYLSSEGYVGIKREGTLVKPVISHMANPIPGEWENHVAGENGWIMAERGDCCLRMMGKDKDARFCSQCGIGIRGVISWRRPDLRYLADLDKARSKLMKD